MNPPCHQRALRLFVSYSHENGAHFERLLRHLKPLERMGWVDAWHDRRIGPGDEWRGAIDQNLERADVVLLLLSADFVFSDYCVDMELRRAMERYVGGSADVVPIVVEPCRWRGLPIAGRRLGDIQALPPGGKAISECANRETAWAQVAAALEELVGRRRDALATDAASPGASGGIDEGPGLLWIPGGESRRGAASDDARAHERERPSRDVAVRGFYLAACPVTNREYARFLRSNPGYPEPEYWRDPRFATLSLPVVGVSWYEARDWCAWAGFRLPTETEWEFACRAGSASTWHFGDDERALGTFAWFNLGPDAAPREVGLKMPNDHGLHDMHGNVGEWCEDDWHIDYRGSFDDERAWVEEPRTAERVVRGGSWLAGAAFSRSAARQGWRARARSTFVGFRPAR